MYDLSCISDTVQKYANITAEIAKVDVEVVNFKLIRVAGTGIFSEDVNKDVSENSHVYKHAIKTGKRQIIYEPRKDIKCKNCKIKDECKETFEISTPIIMNDEIIGVIGMACSNEKSRDVIVNNLDSYLAFLEQISDFIVTKAHEDEEEKSKVAMFDMLKIIIRSMDEGAIIINKNGNVDTINPSAKRQLGIKRIINNEHIDITETGDMVNNSKEYRIKIGENVDTVIGDIFDIPENPVYKHVLLFKDLKGIQSEIYAMTSTVNTLNSENIVGSSQATKKLKEEIKKISDSFSTVLITGESGSGKEVVATAIWQNSDRRKNRFVAINCAAIPEPLLESELFGYVKGAFTGADPTGKIGKFELANNGVIFLDEIGDMPIYLQSKLLRVIQNKKITRIGSNQVIPLDVRIIAATNKNLKEMITQNKFREDLYYRLNVIPVEIPPLRERKEDIVDLIFYFIHYYRKLFGKNFIKIEQETMKKLVEYPWYGNVRELENTVEFMVNMMEDGIVDNNAIPINIRKHSSNSDTKRNDKTGGIKTLKELEQNEIKKAIEHFGDTTEGKASAAKALGIGIATLYRKL
ncbi:transcriptional regulator with PAS, ATPase and Fis domain [Sedimentibacter acidaminivorans]|uniref:Transcriptional regulator with PAS, ATPase and Fis domain n=1 Tax=Sedimentibacter acidaminivorans TaxID=913099 RepID=A0ABS4GDK0_9FIRM|nr:sigma 54-interacting transcriptional regulator [Sedimentibacter acidaminivorans]MBP1925781.1 transcriptional regulator with PAS, ATPase and Fis domain [Sedimentibacter acidaminivorans]